MPKKMFVQVVRKHGYTVKIFKIVPNGAVEGAIFNTEWVAEYDGKSYYYDTKSEALACANEILDF